MTTVEQLVRLLRDETIQASADRTGTVWTNDPDDEHRTIGISVSSGDPQGWELTSYPENDPEDEGRSINVCMLTDDVIVYLKQL